MLKGSVQAAVDYSAAAKKRVEQSPGRLLLLGALAGVFIAFAGVAASIGGALAGKLASAAIFPIGLTMVVLTGSELFTGNCLFLLPLLRREVSVGQVLRSWCFVYLGNLLGSILTACIVVQSGTLDSISEAVLGTAALKAGLPFLTAFLRGILCNFLVCLAVWMAFCAGSAGSKVVSLFGPIFVFVLCGFEHSVANMYYIPAGILLSQDGGMTWAALGQNLLPVTLGNLLGGCLLGGLLYLLHGKKRS